jgi:hypothetical protein
VNLIPQKARVHRQNMAALMLQTHAELMLHDLLR